MCQDRNLQFRALDDKDQEAFRLEYKRNALDYKAGDFKVFQDKDRELSFFVKLSKSVTPLLSQCKKRKRDLFDVGDDRVEKKRKLNHEEQIEASTGDWGRMEC